MKRINQVIITFVLLCTSIQAFALDAPVLTVSTSGVDVSLSWTSVPGATSYTLHYASNPYTPGDAIGQASMGTDTSFSTTLWDGASYYVAVSSYNGTSESGYSNIGLFTITNDQIVCTADYNPVCGVDGNIYSNSCNADVAGVEIDFQGACAACDSNNLSLCTADSTCSSAGGYWWSDNTCNSTIENITPSTECVSGDCFNGQGTYTWANGDIYVGDWVNGLITGQGTYTWANGDIYVGDWVNGLITGQGTYTRVNGAIIEGIFVDGVLETPAPPEPESCDSNNVNLCTTYSTCSSAGGYWYNFSCNLVPDTSLSSPTGVSASQGTYTDQITLDWNSVTGATGYNVYDSTYYSGTYSLLGSVTSSGTTVTSVSAGTTGYFKVTATANGVESAASSIFSGYTSSGGTSAVTYYEVTVSREDSNLYEADFEDLVILTKYCHEFVFYDDAKIYNNDTIKFENGDTCDIDSIYQKYTSRGTYSVTVSRDASNRYSIFLSNDFIQTKHCYEYEYSDDATLEIDSYSGAGTITFSSGDTCDVEGYYSEIDLF
jgi:hypothetical protein